MGRFSLKSQVFVTLRARQSTLESGDDVNEEELIILVRVGILKKRLLLNKK